MEGRDVLIDSYIKDTRKQSNDLVRHIKHALDCLMPGIIHQLLDNSWLFSAKTKELA